MSSRSFDKAPILVVRLFRSIVTRSFDQVVALELFNHSSKVSPDIFPCNVGCVKRFAWRDITDRIRFDLNQSNVGAAMNPPRAPKLALARPVTFAPGAWVLPSWTDVQQANRGYRCRGVRLGRVVG